MRLFTGGLAIHASASPTKRLALDTDILSDQPDEMTQDKEKEDGNRLDRQTTCVCVCVL